MWDEEIKNKITFTYRSYDKNGDQTAFIERSLNGDETDYLPNILLAFQYFLHGLTFTYVDEVVACSGGNEHSSLDEADTF